MLAQILIRECRDRWGLQLRVCEGDKLAVSPKGKAPPELLQLLRQNKGEVVALLKAEAEWLPEDQKPWLVVARQILGGEFAGADSSTVESLTIGLRDVPHPLCKQALARLPDNKEKRSTP